MSHPPRSRVSPAAQPRGGGLQSLLRSKLCSMPERRDSIPLLGPSSYEALVVFRERARLVRILAMESVDRGEAIDITGGSPIGFIVAGPADKVL
jgi:hypothetical protein